MQMCSQPSVMMHWWLTGILVPTGYSLRFISYSKDDLDAPASVLLNIDKKKKKKPSSPGAMSTFFMSLLNKDFAVHFIDSFALLQLRGGKWNFDLGLNRTRPSCWSM